MEKETKNNTGTSDRELIVLRTLDAPVARVWEVWTSPDHIRNWWGPVGFTNAIEHMDVRTGGRWEFIMHGPDSTDYRNVYEYKEVIPQRRIVMNHITAPGFEAHITFTAEDNNRTTIRWHMIFESKEQFEQAIRTFRVDEGLKQNIEKLDHYLSGLS